MISTVLDKTLELFGRSFLITAFIPTLVTTVLLGIVWRGFGQVSDKVGQWVSQGIGGAVLEIVTWFLAVYLVAYAVYGIRSVLRTVFQGVWPGPLKPIQSLFDKLAVWRFRRAADRLERLTDRMNDVAWIVDERTWTCCEPADWNTTPPWRALGDFPPALGPVLRRARRRVRTASIVLDRRRSPEWWLQRCVVRALTAGRAAVTSKDRASPEHQQALAEITEGLQGLCATDGVRRERFQQAAKRAAAWIERERGRAEVRRHANYPPNEEEVRATLFGNVMASLISYPRTRYAIPLDTLWPRLTHVVPEPALRRVDDAAVFVDFSVVSATGAAVVVIGSAAAPFLPDGSVGWAVGFGVGGALAFLAFTRVAITAARSFAEEVEACIDLYRHALLEKLEYRGPGELEAERRTWNAVYDFLSRGVRERQSNS